MARAAPRSWWIVAVTVGLVAVVGLAAPARAQLAVAGGRAYMTPAQAIGEIFGGGLRHVEDGVRLSPETVRRIAETSGSDEVGPDVKAWRIYRDERLVGYAVVLDERGKYRPITFLVGADPAFEVRGVEVLVYREDRGGEVRHRRFLRQYAGKTLADPIRTHRDIVNVTGATISVTSLNTGVRRALATLREVYGSPRAVDRAAR